IQASAPSGSVLDGFEPSQIVAADLNADGIPDLVTVNYISGNSVSVLLGNGDGTFGLPQTLPVGYFPYSVAVADVNGDGKPELVVCNHFGDTPRPSVHGTVSVLLGKGDGTFQPQRTFAVGLLPDTVVVADVNGDGKPDIVTSYQAPAGVSVLLGTGDGTFGP